MPSTFPLRAHAATTSAGALIAVFILARTFQAQLQLGPFYALKASAGFAVVAVLVVAFCEPWHPFARLGPANLVTLVRAALVALIAALIGESATPVLAARITLICLVAASLDGVDGWLARRSGKASAFGARFDLEVDALLILVLAVLVWQYGRAGSWVLLAGLLRYAFVAAGWLRPWLRRPLRPSVRRQIICVVQIGGLIAAMSPWLADGLSGPIAAIALVALGYSFLIDTMWLWWVRRQTDESR